MDDLFVPEPLHRDIMLSASTEEHSRFPIFHCIEMWNVIGDKLCSKPGRPQIIHKSVAMG